MILVEKATRTDGSIIGTSRSQFRQQAIVISDRNREFASAASANALKFADMPRLLSFRWNLTRSSRCLASWATATVSAIVPLSKKGLRDCDKFAPTPHQAPPQILRPIESRDEDTDERVHAV
jgi:hypothetical protein